MKKLMLATLGAMLMASTASATQYRLYGGDRGVVVHAPYQYRFDLRTGRRLTERPGLSRRFGLMAPRMRMRPPSFSRRDRGLVYRSHDDPGIVLHGWQDGYGHAR